MPLENWTTMLGNIAHNKVITPNNNHINVYLNANFFFLVTDNIKMQKITVQIIKIVCKIGFNFIPPYL